MKELSIEEKAKRYDEAIERAKKWYNAPNIDKIPTYGNRVIEEIFPELKESEDDKVRKKLIHLVKKSHEQGGYALHKWESDEMLVWLEKQQKTVWSEDDELRLNTICNLLEDLPQQQNWLKSLKDRVISQPKQEWSEEDIIAIDCAVDVLNKDLPTLAASIKRLKSLRPQKQD